MKSDEKKMGGGSGGGPITHSDVRFVDGTFGRTADFVHFVTYPRSSTARTGIGLQAAGGNAFVQVQAERAVLIETGQPGDKSHPIPDDTVSQSEIIMFAPCGQQILIQRGDFGPDSQTIEMKPDGSINIDAGTSGLLTLSAGPSYIAISPTGITINAAIVKIN